MSSVTDTIEAVVGSLTTTTTFMRISKLEEANKILNTTDLSTDPIALYYSIDTVTAEPVEGRSVEVHPVEIAFVDKAASADTSGVEDEVTRDAMRTSAIEFYHSLVKNYTGIFERFEGYTLEAVIMDKKFDVIMVGYTLKTEIRQLAGFGTVSVTGSVLDPDSNAITTVQPGGIAIVSLQDVWDVSADARKNTFVDANTFEILTFVFSDAAKTVLDFFTGLVTAEVLAIGSFVDSQDAVGALQWPRASFASFALQTEANSLIDWISGNSMTAVNAPTHIPGVAFDFQATQSIQTGFTSGGGYVLDDAMFGVYIKAVDESSGSNGNIITSGGAVGFMQDKSNNSVNIRVNKSTNTSDTPGFQDEQLVLAYREDSANQAYSIDSVEQATSAVASAAVPSSQFTLGNGYADLQLSSWVAGSSIGFDQVHYNINLRAMNLSLSQI